MNDADIAPLAQRLAEENNVDWRRLNGSGANGRIVERDVLEYLARVMAGEESLDPTPEPLPEGMEAWPEEQGMRVRSEAGPDRPSNDHDGGRNGRAHDAAVAARGSVHDARGGMRSEDEDDLLLAGDDLAGGDDEGLLAPPEEAEARPRGEELPDLFDDAPGAGGERARGESPALFDGDVGWDDERRAPAPPSPEEPEDEDAGFDFGGFPGAEEVRGPRPQPQAGPTEAPADDDWRFDDGPAGGEEELGGADIRMDEFELDEDLSGRPGPAAPPASPEPTFEPGERQAAPAAPAPMEPSAGEPARELSLARSRQVLRRQVDLGNALAVQRLLSTSGSAGDDVALAALLLVAARREAGSIGASRPGVAMVDDAGRTVGSTVSGSSLGEVAAQLSAGALAGEGRPDLWVADLSGYGLDDAVLDADVPQLTLGRLLSDGGDGGVRATLALAGDVPLEAGATFLARVAQLVEEPLRLLI